MFDLWYLLCQKLFNEHFSRPTPGEEALRTLVKSGSALSTVSTGFVLEAIIWKQGRKAGPSISTSGYRMQNLGVAGPIGSLNKTPDLLAAGAVALP